MKKLVIFLFSTFLAIGLVGCAQNGQPTNEGVGTVAGGILGALVGSQIGGGSGQAIAIFSGAVIGGYLGNRMGRSMDRNDRRAMQRTMNRRGPGHVRFHDGSSYRAGRVYIRDGRMYRRVVFIDSTGTRIHGQAVCRRLSRRSRCARWEISS